MACGAGLVAPAGASAGSGGAFASGPATIKSVACVAGLREYRRGETGQPAARARQAHARRREDRVPRRRRPYRQRDREREPGPQRERRRDGSGEGHERAAARGEHRRGALRGQPCGRLRPAPARPTRCGARRQGHRPARLLRRGAPGAHRPARAPRDDRDGRARARRPTARASWRGRWCWRPRRPARSRGTGAWRAWRSPPGRYEFRVLDGAVGGGAGVRRPRRRPRWRRAPSISSITSSPCAGATTSDPARPRSAQRNGHDHQGHDVFARAAPARGRARRRREAQQASSARPATTSSSTVRAPTSTTSTCTCRSPRRW